MDQVNLDSRVTILLDHYNKLSTKSPTTMGPVGKFITDLILTKVVVLSKQSFCTNTLQASKSRVDTYSATLIYDQLYIR